MNFDELIIDRPLRAHKYNFDGKRIWTQSNLKDFKLTLGGETVYATDELGTNIMGFDRSKTASAEWSNALLHLGALADQMGTEKQVADGTHKQKFTRVFFLTTEDGSTINLPFEPVKTASVPFKYIDKVDNRNVTLETYEFGSTQTSNFTVAGKVVTLPTDKSFAAGDKFAIKMTYEAESGMAIDDSANKFSEEGVFVIEALCYNPCDKATKILTNIIFPSAKEDASVEVDFNNELTHPMTINATQEYCSEDKKLVRIEVVEE